MIGVSVVGLGKLGACMAACIADRGYRVIGIDSDPKVVELINQGRAPVLEPGLSDCVFCSIINPLASPSHLVVGAPSG